MKKRPGLASLTAVYRREVLSYLTTPTAYVFVAVFLFAIGLFTFQVGGFFESRRADLTAFFSFHPWIFMVVLPAVAMRLWSEESRSGALELLMTLPAPTWPLPAACKARHTLRRICRAWASRRFNKMSRVSVIALLAEESAAVGAQWGQRWGCPGAAQKSLWPLSSKSGCTSEKCCITSSMRRRFDLLQPS